MGPTQPTTQNSLLENTPLGTKYVDPDYLSEQSFSFIEQIFYYLRNNWEEITDGWNTLLFLLSLFFLTIISYTVVRLFEIRAKEKAHLEHEIREYAHHQKEKERKLQEGEGISRNPSWVKVLEYLQSDNESDWKQALMEADTMLEGLLRERGFVGESLGELLKSATMDTFRPLSLAWEVHTMRNKVAHEGSGFHLSLREAKRAIAIYEDIFREFGYI